MSVCETAVFSQVNTNHHISFIRNMKAIFSAINVSPVRAMIVDSHGPISKYFFI